jgi:hypothetical protein
MMKNIAVVLRGHIRTWKYNAPVVFDFFDNISENVDYYVYSWATPGLKMNTIRETFQSAEKTPKHTEYVVPQPEKYTSWSGPAFLATLAAPYIRQEHRQNPYDAVFETRFDTLTTLVPGIPVTPISPNTWYTNCFTNLVDRFGNRNVGMKDHFLAGDVETYCTMADRIIIPSAATKECHVDMLQFAQKNGIKVSNSLPYVNTMMSRPSDRYRVRDPFMWADPHSIDTDHTIPEWHDATLFERIDMLTHSDIEWSDYITDNGNIGVARPGDELDNTLQDHHDKLQAGLSPIGLTDLILD